MKIIRDFVNNRQGTLIENIIYIIIIGALSYSFYLNDVQKPMEENMDALNTKISQWTNTEINNGK